MIENVAFPSLELIEASEGISEELTATDSVDSEEPIESEELSAIDSDEMEEDASEEDTEDFEAEEEPIFTPQEQSRPRADKVSKSFEDWYFIKAPPRGIVETETKKYLKKGAFLFLGTNGNLLNQRNSVANESENKAFAGFLSELHGFS